MNTLRWLWACYSYHFAGADYRRWQCETCRRCRYHPGAHRFKT